MKIKSNHFYREGAWHHLFVKSQNGNVLFYRPDDYLFLYILFSVLVRRYCLQVESFCILFNHFHACLKSPSDTAFYSFCRDLSSLFTIGFNREYDVRGKLMMKCGFAPKTSGKAHRSCLIYIANNPVAGKLVSNAIEYKWNLLAYFKTRYPFSEQLVKRDARFAMRQSLSFIDGCYHRNQYLNYTALKKVLADLNRKEKLQMIDYIVNTYFFLDKQSFVNHFDSFETALIAIDSSAGSEQDIFEPWEDYSIYLSMLRKTLGSGLDYKGFRFHKMSYAELCTLRSRLLRISGTTSMHVARFLHMSE